MLGAIGMAAFASAPESQRAVDVLPDVTARLQAQDPASAWRLLPDLQTRGVARRRRNTEQAAAVLFYEPNAVRHRPQRITGAASPTFTAGRRGADSGGRRQQR